MKEFEYKLDLLKLELSSIENSIKKMDDLGNSTKNWAIVTWIGSIGILLKDPSLHPFIFITAFPPIVFMFADAHWRRLQRRFSFRYNTIGKFVNSQKFTECFNSDSLEGVRLLDSFSREFNGTQELQEYISLKKVLLFPTVSLIYFGQMALSVITAVLINVPSIFASGT